MIKHHKQRLRLIVAAVSLSILVACAAPATRAFPISDAELRQEQRMQQEMARKYPPKKIVRKHRELAFYQNRLLKVARPLQTAAKQIVGNNEPVTFDYKVIDRAGLIAWTNGKSVVVTTEMMDFLETDKELATVIAHELSHNIMGHHAKQSQNYVLGALLDIAAGAAGGVNTGGIFSSIGSMSYSQAFENEADYVGVYMMAIAGYDVSNVHNIWRKMTVQTQSGVQASFFSSHPSNAERYIRLKRAGAEVLAKKQAGKQLIPNFDA
ncbi:MAG TPA: M48 family metalloprotease [Gammaproteobacteria bacterium]|nr:M48 family metalloprotease [Gammaproteobacteria bacterium]